MYCPKCGTYNEDSYRFCLSCGTVLNEQSSRVFDKKTSDGRYIIDPEECNVAPVAEPPTVVIPTRSEVNRQVQNAKKESEQAEDPALEVLPQSEQENGSQRGAAVADDVIVLREAEPRGASEPTRGISSAAYTQTLPRGFRIFLACCAVLVLWIVLSAVIIPGLDLRKQGVIIQVVVMCSALAAIKASWKLIVGDNPKSDKKKG